MKVGAMAESFRTDFKTAVQIAAKLGAEGIQAYANGETIHTGMSCLLYTSYIRNAKYTGAVRVRTPARKTRLDEA